MHGDAGGLTPADEFLRRLGAQLVGLKKLVGPVMDETTTATILERVNDARRRRKLRAKDTAAICRRMVRPDVLAKIRFPSDLLAEFSSAMRSVLEDRDRLEEQTHRAGQDAVVDGAERARVQALLKDLVAHFRSQPEPAF